MTPEELASTVMNEGKKQAEAMMAVEIDVPLTETNLLYVQAGIQLGLSGMLVALHERDMVRRPPE